MEDLWRRIEAWATKNTGRSLRLRPGASEASIAALEAEIGRRLPDDYRASLLLHDGQEGDGDSEGLFPWMAGCAPLASVERIRAAWKDERDFDQDEEPGPYDGDPRLMWLVRHPNRIPIAGNQWWDGDNTYIDFLPGPRGTPGQLITFVTECDMVVLAATFRRAVELYAHALESGDYRWDGKKESPVPKAQKDDAYPNQAGELAKYMGERG